MFRYRTTPYHELALETPWYFSRIERGKARYQAFFTWSQGLRVHVALNLGAVLEALRHRHHNPCFQSSISPGGKSRLFDRYSTYTVQGSPQDDV